MILFFFLPFYKCCNSYGQQNNRTGCQQQNKINSKQNKQTHKPVDKLLSWRAKIICYYACAVTWLCYFIFNLFTFSFQSYIVNYNGMGLKLAWKSSLWLLLFVYYCAFRVIHTKYYRFSLRLFKKKKTPCSFVCHILYIFFIYMNVSFSKCMRLYQIICAFYIFFRLLTPT